MAGNGIQKTTAVPRLRRGTAQTSYRVPPPTAGDYFALSTMPFKLYKAGEYFTLSTLPFKLLKGGERFI